MTFRRLFYIFRWAFLEAGSYHKKKSSRLCIRAFRLFIKFHLTIIFSTFSGFCKKEKNFTEMTETKCKVCLFGALFRLKAAYDNYVPD